MEKERGLSLIEVLIFVLLMSLIMIPLAQLSVVSLRNTIKDERKVLATHYADEAQEWMKSQKEINFTQFAATAIKNTGATSYCLTAFPNDLPPDATNVSSWGTPCADATCSGCSYSAGAPEQPVFKRYGTFSCLKEGIKAVITTEWKEGNNTHSVPITTILSPSETGFVLPPNCVPPPIPTPTPTQIPIPTPIITSTPTPTPSCLAGVPPSLCNWTIAKTVTISNTTGSVLTNYQVKVILPSPLSGMKGDFGDVRFADSSGTVELSHWREMPLTTPTIFWVKVPSVPTGFSTAKLVYGKADASSTSNGKNAFPIYFDFDDGDYTGWTVYTGSSSGVSSGILTWNALSIYPGGMFYTGAQMTRTQLVDARLNTSNNFCGLGFLAQDKNNYYINRGVDAYRLGKILGTGEINSDKWWVSGTNYSAGVFRRYTSYFNGSTVFASIDDGVSVFKNDVSFASGYVGLASWCGSPGTIQLDWILVREYRSPEPTTTVEP